MEQMARELDWAAANATRRAARETRAAVYQQARDFLANVEAFSQSLREAAELYVRARPWQMIGVALAAGIIVGLLLGRRESPIQQSMPSLWRR